MNPDDERLGELLRTIRKRSGVTQETLAGKADIPVDDVIDIESGRIGKVKVDRARRAFAAVEARLRMNAWWNGAAADQLLDREHASTVEAAASVLRRRGWQTKVEVTFSEFGERGSIDLFALHEKTYAVAVCEIKSTFGSLEETNRSLDVKVRLAPKLAARTFGVRPTHLGRLLILPSSSTARSIVRRHEVTMTSAYPARSRDIRTWLRAPDRSISGIWFLSNPVNHQIESGFGP